MIAFDQSRKLSGRKTVCLAAAMGAVFCCSSALAGAQMGYTGKAFATSVTVSPGTANLHSGSTAVTELCADGTGVTHTNTIASVGLGALAATGAGNTAVASASSGSQTAATATATVAGINLLNGLISADTLTAASSSISGAAGLSTSASGTIFTNLKVLGIALGVDVAPNTTIALPGIGSVVLNEQTSKVTARDATMTINMIHVSVSQLNLLGLPVGTELIVAHAQSKMLVNESLLRGFAYGSSVSAGPLQVGRSADVTLACTGTGNILHTNSIAGVSVPSVVGLGAIRSTAQGLVKKTQASGETTSTVAATNLLAGLVTADALKADATAAMNGGITLGDSGSNFVNLVVAGHPEITGTPAPNTQVEIAGLGTLWLNRVIKTKTSIEVRMIELEVSTASLGLPVGADIRIAVAHMGMIDK